MKTLLNFKIDTELKEKAQEVAAELGFPLSTLLNAYLKQFIKTREVYFSDIHRMTPELEQLIGQIEDDVRKKKNIIGPFKSGQEMDEYLDSVSNISRA